MTDWNERVDQIRKTAEASRIRCKAIGCPSVCERGDTFCLKHWGRLGRDLRASLVDSDLASRQTILEKAIEYLDKLDAPATGGTQ
jgi:hypothetical protein